MDVDCLKPHEICTNMYDCNVILRISRNVIGMFATLALFTTEVLYYVIKLLAFIIDLRFVYYISLPLTIPLTVPQTEGRK
jgi:hypothetical protein